MEGRGAAAVEDEVADVNDGAASIDDCVVVALPLLFASSLALSVGVRCCAATGDDTPPAPPLERMMIDEREGLLRAMTGSILVDCRPDERLGVVMMR